jgi:hypothetical protein
MTQDQWSGVLDVSLNGSSRYRSRKAGPHGAAGLIEVLASDRLATSRGRSCLIQVMTTVGRRQSVGRMP